MNSSEQQFEMTLAIPAVYKAGEWRLSKQVIGPRGGKNWLRLTHGIAATGGALKVSLTPGLYKTTVWANGWPSCSCFLVSEDGTVENIS